MQEIAVFHFQILSNYDIMRHRGVDDMKEKYSPMMQQYLKIKEDNKDAIVMFRLGDFYEMFFDDAIVTSKALNLP